MMDAALRYPGPKPDITVPVRHSILLKKKRFKIITVVSMHDKEQ